MFVHIKGYPGTRQGLEDYLRDVTASGIYRRSMSPDDCIAEFQKFGIPDDHWSIDKLRRWRFKIYGWPEYLQIAVLPPINVTPLLKGDPAAVNQLHEQLKSQIGALILLDKIYRR